MLVLTMFISGFLTDKSWNRHEITGSVLSLLSICIFTICFFNADIYRIFGYWLLPMVIIGGYWEFIRAVQETEAAKGELEKEPELDEKERDLMLNIAIAFNAFIVVPGYVMGIVLCFHLLGLS